MRLLLIISIALYMMFGIVGCKKKLQDTPEELHDDVDDMVEFGEVHEDEHEEVHEDEHEEIHEDEHEEIHEDEHDMRMNMWSDILVNTWRFM